MEWEGQEQKGEVRGRGLRVMVAGSFYREGPSFLLFLCFEYRPGCLEFEAVLLFLPPEFWYCRLVPPDPAAEGLVRRRTRWGMSRVDFHLPVSEPFFTFLNLCSFSKEVK